MVPHIEDIARFLETWAPKGAAQSYDNVGLQVGDKNKSVSCALIALDLSPDVLDEAIAVKADLILTHHPVIFRPIRAVTANTLNGRLVLRLAESGIALYCVHTNLDVAHDGVSFTLAARLGLVGNQFLDKLTESLFKLVTFVPENHFHAVREAIAMAGAGHIGEYEACAFASEGTGYFRPGTAAHPFIGSAGGALESVPEIKIETEVTRWNLNRVICALKSAHPYEEVAFDIYPVHQTNSRFGMGAIGRLDPPEPLFNFLERVSDRLQAHRIRYVGISNKSIERVAVCGGSGSDLIHRALQEGADAYVTGDITYHKYFDVLNPEGVPDMALIDAGHYETERYAEDLLLSRLQQRFQSVKWVKTKKRTCPYEVFTGHSTVI